VSEPTPPPSDALPEAAPEAAAPEAAAPAAVPQPRRSGLDAASLRPTIIVAAIIAALFYGTQILNEALPAAASDVAVTAGGAIEIGEGAVITPFADWAATAHENTDGVRLEKGIVVIDLFASTFASSAGELADAYRTEVLEADTTQFTATRAEIVTITNGTTGVRFRYQGLFTGVDVAIEGEVTVLYDAGVGVVADAWTRQGDLDAGLGEIHDMLETIEVHP
jgi:hypothetical protein